MDKPKPMKHSFSVVEDGQVFKLEWEASERIEITLLKTIRRWVDHCGLSCEMASVMVNQVMHINRHGEMKVE